MWIGVLGYKTRFGVDRPLWRDMDEFVSLSPYAVCAQIILAHIAYAPSDNRDQSYIRAHLYKKLTFYLNHLLTWFTLR